MSAPNCITIRKAYKFRLYPTVAQQRLFAFHFGSVRYVWNHFLAERKAVYRLTGKTMNSAACCRLLTQLKRQSGKEWLQEGYNQSYQQSLRDQDKAYQNFFRRVKAGEKAGLPKFKSKYGSQSIRYAFDQTRIFCVKDGRIRIPKVGMVKLVQHRSIAGSQKNMTVSRTKSGCFFVSIQIEEQIPKPVPAGGSIGIDLGLSSFATLSDGRVIESPRFLRKSLKRLVRLQRSQSRKKKGSNNRQKAKILVARQYEKIANQRKDFLHKLSRKLVEENSHIGIEDLNVKGMSQGLNLGKSVGDAGMGEFVRQLEYKGEWYGCQTVKVDRFFPSSKICGDCGGKNQGLKLSDRRWGCEGCGSIHDRDLNAAKNILKESRARAVQSDAQGDMSRGNNLTQPGNSNSKGSSPTMRSATGRHNYLQKRIILNET